MKWIKCSERLPDKERIGEHFLIYSDEEDEFHVRRLYYNEEFKEHRFTYGCCCDRDNGRPYSWTELIKPID